MSERDAQCARHNHSKIFLGNPICNHILWKNSFHSTCRETPVCKRLRNNEIKRTFGRKQMFNCFYFHKFFFWLLDSHALTLQSIRQTLKWIRSPHCKMLHFSETWKVVIAVASNHEASKVLFFASIFHNYRFSFFFQIFSFGFLVVDHFVTFHEYLYRFERVSHWNLLISSADIATDYMSVGILSFINDWKTVNYCRNN